MTEQTQQTTTQPKPGQRRYFPKTIEVEITDEENTVRMKEHLEVERKIDAVKAKRAAATGEFSQELKELSKHRGALLNTIATKKELRDIQCYEVPHFPTNRMIIRRADTDEQLDERPLTLEERQEPLPLKPTGKAAKNGTAAKPDDGIVDNDYGKDGADKAEDKAIEQETAAAKASGSGGSAGEGGKVKRIKASDVSKEKAARKAKGSKGSGGGKNGRTERESNGAGE